jgi:hypothetical protein
VLLKHHLTCLGQLLELFSAHILFPRVSIRFVI